ncbi:hypothetical protein CA834_10165 [Winogradskyella aurantia]|uniref:Uncharacterized protein n=1 Tax=Winogradskyella aurantia TaxID=1915063 RepID=A0A265USF7_9FLAO|nr:hypothetical protein CA834_10165 [Winogradskyella aurantia]
MKSLKNNWTIARTLLFIIIGLLNTVFIKPEDVGTWKNYVGYGVLLIAIVDIFTLVKPYLKRNKNEK